MLLEQFVVYKPFSGKGFKMKGEVKVYRKPHLHKQKVSKNDRK